MTARWTRADSEDLDRAIRAMRKADRPLPSPTNKATRQGVQTSDYQAGFPRGVASPHELARREHHLKKEGK